MHVGAHQSIAKGLRHLGEEARTMGADTFQCFLRNPRGAAAKPFDPAEATALRAFLADHTFGPFVAHAPYTLNLCSDSPQIRQVSQEMLRDDLERMAHLPGNYYNLHPGSHRGQGPQAAAEQIAAGLDPILQNQTHTMLLLETMAGKGTEMGRSFQEIRWMIHRVENRDRIGVCFDACHLYSAGYDIVGDLDGVLREFHCVLGLDRLRAFHLNDSAFPFASHKDRHLPLGQGYLGWETIRRILAHPALQDLLLILETPLDSAGHRREIAQIRQEWIATGAPTGSPDHRKIG